VAGLVFPGGDDGILNFFNRPRRRDASMMQRNSGAARAAPSQQPCALQAQMALQPAPLLACAKMGQSPCGIAAGQPVSGHRSQRLKFIESTTSSGL